MHFVIETYSNGRTVLCRDRQLTRAFSSLAVARRFAESLRIHGSSRRVATHSFETLLRAEAYVAQQNASSGATDTPLAAYKAPAQAAPGQFLGLAPYPGRDDTSRYLDRNGITVTDVRAALGYR